jgi:UPF0755 protein
LAKPQGRIHIGEVIMSRAVRFILKVLSTGLAAILVIVAAAFFVVKYFEAPPPFSPELLSTNPVPGVRLAVDGSIEFELPSGESASFAGNRLQDAGLIRSSLLWSLVARLDSAQLKAGTYRLEPPLSMFAIRDILVSGRQLLIRVTVPEGFTLHKTATLLESAGVTEAASFLAAATSPELLRSYGVPASSMEGYLYPDTYFFPKDFPADQVVKKMADTFFQKIAAMASESSSLTPQELFQRVVIASIVEREYRAADEAPLMAGVFYNRLKIGMALQSCATVEYVITEIQGKPHPEVLYNRDIAIPHPYNTYVNRGLPPGPISAPGSVALEAAFRPKATDFLYFRLVDPSEGRHRFSKTLDEHVQAGVIYLKRGATSR